MEVKTWHISNFSFFSDITWKPILGDPGAASREDAIFLGESLLQELKSPWELSPADPVPDVVEFRPDWAEKYFSAQSARTSSQVTLSPSYTT